MFKPHTLLTAAIVAVLPMLCAARGEDKSKVNPLVFSEEVFMDMEFEPNLATPEVPANAKEGVRRAVTATAKALSAHFTVDLMRDDEVCVVTIPAEQLFLPNDTLLMPEANTILGRLVPSMVNPDEYKIVIAMHTDNTGSDLYREELSIARLNSIYDWCMTMIDRGSLKESLIIIPYSMASSMPLCPNDSRNHRRMNRRLEVYFVPGPGIIKEALTNANTGTPKRNRKKSR